MVSELSLISGQGISIRLSLRPVMVLISADGRKMSVEDEARNRKQIDVNLDCLNEVCNENERQLS